MGHIAMVVTNACAPDPRVERHARWLVEEGHTVDIFAWDREMRYPALENRHGYRIHRKQYGWTKKAGPIRTWFRKKKFISSLKIKADLLILNDTDTANVSFDGKILLDIHDMAHTWPLMRGTSFMHKKAAKSMLKDAKRILNLSDSIITSAPGFQKWVKSEGYESQVVMNRRNPEYLEQALGKVVGYIGRIREIQSMRYLISAAKKAGFRVIAAGDGLAVKQMLTEFPNLDYRGPFTEEQLPELIKEISVMYAMYSTDRGNIAEGAIPTKMLDAAAFGRPSVVNQNTPMGDFCEQEELGITAPFGNIDEIANAILEAHGMQITNVKGEDREIFLAIIKKLRV
jgi:glycosyltransferase involved in cell wall biosynthesis